MGSARALACAVSAIVLMAACTSGQTQGPGVAARHRGDGRHLADRAHGSDGDGGDWHDRCGRRGGVLARHSPPVGSGISDFAFFSCNGLEGTWHYIFYADFGQGIAFDVDAEVDMDGGDGTLVFGEQIDVPDLGSVSFTDTVELRLVGTDALEATSVRVEVDTNIPGFGNFFETFREGEQLPIVPGSDRC